MLSSFEHRRRLAGFVSCLALAAAVAGCGTVVLTESGALTRYDRLAASDETASSSRIFCTSMSFSAWTIASLNAKRITSARPCASTSTPVKAGIHTGSSFRCRST